MDTQFQPPNAQQVTLLFVGAFICYLTIKAIARIYFSPLSKVPGPWYTAISELWFLWKNVGGGSIFAIDNLHQKYGPYVRIAPDIISCADIESAQKIHSTHDIFRKSKWYEKLRKEVDTLPLITDLESYKNRRRAYGNAFSNSNLSLLEPAIRRNVYKCVKKINQVTEADRKVDLLKWTQLLAMEIIGELCYGLDFKMLEDENIHPMLEDANSYVLLVRMRAFFPIIHQVEKLLSYIPHPKIQQFVGIENRVYSFGEKALFNTQRQVHNCKDGKSASTFFAKILDGMDNPDIKSKMTMTMAQQETLLMVAAASDTTSLTATYLIWVILRHKEVRQKMVEEINTIASNGDLAEDSSITDESLKQLPYLKMVIMEVMRLYCAAQLALQRVVPNGGRQFGPYFLPQETRVCAPTYTLHRDPAIFPDPDR
ncbi:hypothetical protein ABW21_db0206181 [Orbilia brochopaga]|nr:hypothetical protein ABW21_db0206181 [Drechslerella brochopaga]